ncbi:MAG: hypothetical protein ACI4W6_07810, partial [Acutalibacteraceae bacterium]
MSYYEYPLISGSIENQLKQIKSYLYRQAEMLNYNHDNNSAEKIWQRAYDAVSFDKRTEGLSKDEVQKAKDNYQSLKDLVISTAHTAYKSEDSSFEKFDSRYVAISDFGTYQENISKYITENAATKTELSTLSATVDNKLDKSYQLDMANYIKTGYLDTSSADPIYGIEVGLLKKTFSITYTDSDGKEQQKEVENANPCKIRIQPNRISFFNGWTDSNNIVHNDVEVAYIAKDAIYFPNAHITGGTIQIGDHFNVDNSGNVTATSGSFTGTIEANDGTIGGWFISETGGLRYQKKDENGNDISFNNGGWFIFSPYGHTNAHKICDYTTTDWILSISNKFGVTGDGYIYAESATIKGNITATSLTLDGATIPYSGLSDAPLIKDDNGNFYKGTASNGSTGISISSAGLLTAANAVIYGTIYASAGEIANFTINGNYLYTGSGSKKTFLRNVSGDDHVVFAAGVSASDHSGFTTTAISNAPFYIRNDGSIKAKQGIIGGFTIGDRCIYNGKDSATSTDAGIYIGTDGIKVGSSSDSSYVKIYSDGSFKANSADITGKVTASEGVIGGFTIGAKSIYNGKNSATSEDAGIYIGTDGIKVGSSSDSSYVKIYSDGSFKANSADITGKVTASSGEIGGWTLTESRLYNGTWGSDNSAMLCPAGSDGSKSIGGSGKISGWTITSGSNFGVTKKGILYAKDAVFEGITVNRGSFTSKYDETDTIKISGSTIDLLAYPAQIRFKDVDETTKNALQYIPAANYGDVGLIVGNEDVSLYLKGYTISEEQYISSSDLRLKSNIQGFDKRYEEFFCMLN